jgi:hypothetical protein
MKRNLSYSGLSLLMAAAALFGAVVPAQAQDKKPNILFIMGDRKDISVSSVTSSSIIAPRRIGLLA